MKFPTLLITSAINPAKNIPHLKMTNPEVRSFRTIKAVKKWQSLIPDLKIVLIDGTNTNLQKYFDKNVECLYYENDLVKDGSKGKGYGEGQDIVFAIKNSETINSYPNIMKVTGKYWVENIFNFKNKDLFADFKCKAAISNTLSLLYVNTTFMCFSKDFYLSKFENLYKEVNDQIHHNDLEHLMAELILKEKLKNYIFSEIPIMQGWCGSGDHIIDLYPNNFRHFFRKIKYKLISKII